MQNPLQLTLPAMSDHGNHYLFSDHYLDHLLPDDPCWGAALSDAKAFLAWLQGIYTQESGQLARYNESQLEDHWFKPILTRLGHVFEGQASIPGLGTEIKRPDFVFFLDDAARQAAVKLQRKEEYADHALAVGEVKKWGVPLGKKQKGGGASFESQNPSWQTDYYVRAAGVDWGILSNGRLWRLVHADSSQRLSIFYEIDLVDLLTRGDAGAMRYFTVFFRQAAFRPDVTGRVFLQDALDASTAYAVALEEDLETNVYRALERLMQSFLDLPQNGLGADDLSDIYENSLYLLYRLLFILYGESRGLLPLNKISYRDSYSLQQMEHEIARHTTPLAPMTTLYWGRLKQLFQIINGDNVALNAHLGVPRYNGGLFDPELHPFLAEHAVGDAALVEAIDLLSRRRTEAGREFVDYRTLGVRHLGSIYEGLLEYQPRYAAEATLAIREGGSERWVAEAEVPDGARVIDRREAERAYLATDKGERKATGSYYTPQYIVEYIVQNTLGSLVAEATERVKERARGARKKADRAAAEQSLVDEVLEFKVLDPAMGSGHFLVEATEYLALALATDPYVEVPASSGEGHSPEEDLTYWRRRVVERCIYGVDKNPLAVELAKLSLWLATVAEDKPLSFLDHHLKCGDSLVGARVEDLGWPPPILLDKRAQRQLEQRKAGQLNMFEYALSQRLPVVMGRILEIAAKDSDDYDTVQAKEAADQAVRALKAPFQAVADLWTSAYFGHEYTVDEYAQALDAVSEPQRLLGLPAMRRAREIADEYRFFHWEIAFPEVFYDRNGQPLNERAGFDAVIGNPPYLFLSGKGSPVRRLQKEERADEARNLQREIDYLSTIFWRSSQGCRDYYKWFIEQCLQLTRLNGWSSYVVSNTWIVYPKFADIRRLLAIENHLMELVDIGSDVFRDPTVLASIFVVKKEDLSPNLYPIGYADLKRYQHKDFNNNIFHEVLRLHRSTTQINGENLEIQVYRSSVAARLLLDAPRRYPEPPFVIHEGEHDVVIERQALRISPSANSVPIVLDWEMARYLSPPIMYLPRDVAGVSVHSFHRGKRLLLRKTGDTIMAAPPANYQDALAHQNVYVIKLSDYSITLEYVLALLNSRLLTHLYQNSPFGQEGRVQAQFRIDFLYRLPIRCIQSTTPSGNRQQFIAEARAESDQAVHTIMSSDARDSDTPLERAGLVGAAEAVLSVVEDRLSAQPEQADVVHDLLAHLAEQMIEMNKSTQARVEDFWLDLEGMTDAGTFEVLRNKGRHERTLWKHAAACRPFARQESGSTRTLDESLAWSEEAFKAFIKALVGTVHGFSGLVSVYRAHASAYRDLLARIQATDWLIDQIVYKLYGLTEEEITIVEGQS